MKSTRYSLAVQDHLLRGGPAPVSDMMLSVSLHSEDPASESEQTAYEIPGVGRASIPRKQEAWGNDGTKYTNLLPVRFPRAAQFDGKRVARFWSICDSSGGVLITGKLDEEQEIVAGSVLEFKPGSLVSEEF